MNTRKVSIITVCKNSEATIRGTIESVLHQTYRKIEYIIVDGGSTDGTLSIIEEYIPLFQGRMRYISEQDQGIYDAMNKGIMLATGDLIGIINSDDWYEWYAVERAVKCFHDSGAGVVYGEIWMADQVGNLKYHTAHSAFPMHPATFVSRETYQRYGAFHKKYKIAADRELLLRFMSCGVRFVHTDEVLAYFRETGISSNRVLECAEETYEIDMNYIGKCPEHVLNKEEAQERYERSRLLYISKRTPGEVYRAMAECCDLSKGIVIFGAGKCGRELGKIFRECNVPVKFFVDNEEGKWELECNGIKIFSPKILRHYSGYVVISVTRFKEEICGQLRGYGNPMLVWSGVEEIRREIIDRNEKMLMGEMLSEK